MYKLCEVFRQGIVSQGFDSSHVQMAALYSLLNELFPSPLYKNRQQA